MSGDTTRLYNEDFVRWTEEQAAALRDAAGLGISLPLDWENLAEEIDSLGRSQRRELRHRIATIIEHLIKLECSPAGAPGQGWIDTIDRERINIEDLLDDSPSLRSEVARMISRETPRTIKLASRGLRSYAEMRPEIITRISNVSYTEEQVLGDWFPGDVAISLPPRASRERE